MKNCASNDLMNACFFYKKKNNNSKGALKKINKCNISVNFDR